jgi:hypothetical protein
MITRQKSTKHFWLKSQFLPLFLLFIDPLAVRATNQFWLSAKTNALGTSMLLGGGSPDNPFYGDFDFIIDTIPPNSTINLLAGVFYTKGFEYVRGDPKLIQNQHMIGAGTNATIIRRDLRFHFHDAPNVAVFSDSDGVEISSLTIDCNNTTGTNPYKGDAITLFGNNSSVYNVNVINSSGNNEHGEEDFAILVGATNTTGNSVSECEVSSVQGDYTDAITLLGQGVVSFCHVYYTNLAFGAGYQFNGSYNALLISNSCVGGQKGFYTDTLSETNLTIAYNTFSCSIGINFNKGSPWNVNGLTITGNSINIVTNGPGWKGGYAYGILMYPNGTNYGISQYKNVSISGNSIASVANYPGMFFGHSTGVSIYNNILWSTNSGYNEGMIFLIGCSNTLTANNLCYAKGGSMVGIGLADTVPGTDKVLNNMIIGCNSDSLQFKTNASVSVCDSNLFYPFVDTMPLTLAQWRALGFDTHSVAANPLFVNTNTWNFQLTSNSPAIAQAVNLTANGITTDASGNSRPATGNWDIGPYEFEVSSAMQPPTHLQIHGLP